MDRPPDDLLAAVAADASGRIVDLPGLAAVGRAGDDVEPLRRSGCIPLPEGSELFLLPGRAPFALGRGGGPAPVADATAAAAFLAPAHTQLLTAAFSTRPGAPRLPLFAYTTVGWRRGRFWAPAVRVDPDRR